MITFCRTPICIFQAVNYRLPGEQFNFSAEPAFALRRIEQRQLQGDYTAHPFVVLANKKIVGFLILDFGVDKYSFLKDENCVLLRSFSISPKHQGCGYGTQTIRLLEGLIKAKYPQCTAVVLGVHEKNAAAKHVYQQAGYTCGENMRMGRSGLEYKMIKHL